MKYDTRPPPAMYFEGLGLTPEEVCAKIPEPQKRKCLKRVASMLGAARKERMATAAWRIGSVVGLAVAGVASYLGYKWWVKNA